MNDQTEQPEVIDTHLAPLYADLAQAHSEFPPIPRSRTVNVRMKSGGVYSFKYAPLEETMAKVRPPLSKHGFALMQRIVPLVNDTKAVEAVETMLVHKSGASIGNRVRVIVLETGPQGYKSALTYARRSGVELLLVLAAEDDDDGNQAEGNSAEFGDEPLDRDRGRPASVPRVDEDLMAEYVKRIVGLVDNADPKGALVLYQELNQLERDFIWPKLLEAGKVKGERTKYTGELRQASRDEAGQP